MNLKELSENQDKSNLEQIIYYAPSHQVIILVIVNIRDCNNLTFEGYITEIRSKWTKTE